MTIEHGVVVYMALAADGKLLSVQVGREKVDREKGNSYEAFCMRVVDVLLTSAPRVFVDRDQDQPKETT